MTINTWRNEILNVCKYCKHLTDVRKSRNRYRCGKYECHVYDAHKCRKTYSIRVQAEQLSKVELEKSFFLLTRKQMEINNVR